MVARWLDINLPEHSTISTFKQVGYNLKVKREKNDKKINLTKKKQKIINNTIIISKYQTI